MLWNFPHGRKHEHQRRRRDYAQWNGRSQQYGFSRYQPHRRSRNSLNDYGQWEHFSYRRGIGQRCELWGEYCWFKCGCSQQHNGDDYSYRNEQRFTSGISWRYGGWSWLDAWDIGNYYFHRLHRRKHGRKPWGEFRSSVHRRSACSIF